MNLRRTGTVLDRILDKKTEAVAELKSRRPAQELKRLAKEAPPARNFLAALRDCPRVPIIAEIKKASPSAGSIKTGVDVAVWAAEYEAGGAAALSVLTDGPFFGGDLEDLAQARDAVSLPVLRKDFIIDAAQIHESRAAGADAILLIAAALDPSLLSDLFHEATEAGLTVLVEAHTEEELAEALALNPPLLGINNRDLKTMTVSLETCLRLRPLVPEGALVAAESGIGGPEDVSRLRQGGLEAFLIGTTLMKSPDPRATLARLCTAGD